MRSLVALCALVVAFSVACGGGSGEPLPAGTVALVETIRGEGNAQRIASGSTIEIAGLSRVMLDTGPRLLVRDGSFQITEDGTVELNGTAFVEVHPGDVFAVGQFVLRRYSFFL